MSLKFGIARALGAVSTWGLRDVLHRPAGNFPGKIALYADPSVIADLRPRLASGSIIVVGTNGKTTVTNMLADALEAAGKKVACNRTGANLDSGIATSLLQTPAADWGIFECDELWLAKVLPHLRSDYVVLLNLFRDQLDRMGEIDYIQESIVGALTAAPETVLVYNADDPQCQAIADRVENGKVAFGIGESLDFEQNTVADASMCQECATMLEYEYRSYGQLGAYHCPNCGFGRPQLNYAAKNVSVSENGLSFTVESGAATADISAPFSGLYMVYNLTAVCAAGVLVGLPLGTVQQAIDVYDPKNGRLQEYCIEGRPVLLNLAKNPTGFNQNLNIVLQGEGPKAVAFFVNDKEGDGRDVSWLWDIDFDELTALDDLRVFAGGMRRNDLQVCLKYAGLDAELVDGGKDVLARLSAQGSQAKAYLIANYTSLPVVKAEIDKLVETGEALPKPSDAASEVSEPLATEALEAEAQQQEGSDEASTREHLTIVRLFPKLLNLYGDGGNVKILKQRALRRGIPVQVIDIDEGMSFDAQTADIVFLGGGPDREQHLASQLLLEMADDLRAYVEDDGVMLAICGGFQIIGREWLMGDETVKGLGLIDMTTGRAEGGSHNRLVDNVVLNSPLADMPVIGYENHAGRTYLGEGLKPFGRIVGSHGKGNNEKAKADGVLYRNVVGTYLHGPLLAKNPEVADTLIERALARRAQKEERPSFNLVPLDDAEEKAANAFMCKRLGIH